MAFVVTLVLYRTIITLVVGPFLGPLMTQVENICVGQSAAGTFREELGGTLVSVWTSVRLSCLALGVLIVSFCAGPLALILNLIVQSYVLGRESFEVVFEKLARSRTQRKELARRYRPEIFGAGLIFFLILLVPFLGVLIGPVASAVGAGLVVYTDED